MIVVYIVLGLLVLLIAVMLIRAMQMKPTDDNIEKIDGMEVNADRAIKSLSEAIKCKTVSRPNPDDVDWAEFDKLQKHIVKTYPLIHKKLKREVIAEHSLLYTWQGTDNSLEPLALLAHQDVVPVMPGTEGDWVQEAFSGHIDDKYIWGRGTLDMKHQLIGVLEAVETMLEKNIQPKRTVYLCFGHNEEVVGSVGGGAQAIAQTLLDRGVRLGCVIDEGGAVTEGKPFGINKHIAMTGTCEKGYADIKITANHPGGHASQPPKDNGLVQVCDAIVKLYKNQFNKRLIKPVEATFMELGKYMGFGMRIVLANIWITKPLLLAYLAKTKFTNAMIRTTISPTMAEGSPAGNVLPQTANITVNFRVLQGQKIEDVFNHIRKVTKNDNLKIELLRGKEPSEISPIDSYEYGLINSTLKQIFGDVPMIPYLMVGGTDSCFFECITDNIYCISPFMLSTEEIGMIHGTNERIKKYELEKGVKFFIQFIENYCM